MFNLTYTGLLYIFVTFYLEIIVEVLSYSSPILNMTILFTTINVTISQAFTVSIMDHHSSRASSVEATTTIVSYIIQTPLGMLTCGVRTYVQSVWQNIARLTESS